jgi:hypothetical protein
MLAALRQHPDPILSLCRCPQALLSESPHLLVLGKQFRNDSAIEKNGDFGQGGFLGNRNSGELS